jgi:hypothetical protein
MVTFLFFIFISLQGLERNMMFVVVKLFIALTVQHYLGRVIGDCLFRMHHIYSFHIYVVLHKLNIKLQK